MWPEYPTTVRETIGEWWNAFPVHYWLSDRLEFEAENLVLEEECSVEDLAALSHVINEVLEASESFPGKVSWGYSPTNEGNYNLFKKGKVIADPSTAKRLLPIEGGWERKYDYDQYYVKQLEEIQAVLRIALASPVHMSFTYAVR